MFLQILEALLPKGLIVPSAFETVGHIVHLNLKEEHLPYKNLIAKVLFFGNYFLLFWQLKSDFTSINFLKKKKKEKRNDKWIYCHFTEEGGFGFQVVLDKNKPKIHTIVNKIEAIHNDYRTMQLEVLAGNHSLVTTVVENGMRFHVDLTTVYVSLWLQALWEKSIKVIECLPISCYDSKLFASGKAASLPLLCSSAVNTSNVPNSYWILSYISNFFLLRSLFWTSLNLQNQFWFTFLWL